MKSKILNLEDLFFNDSTEQSIESHYEVTSLDEISRKTTPVNDFRDIISNLSSVENTMLEKAKTISDKKNLLITWEKLSILLNQMCFRLKYEIEKSLIIEQKLLEAKEEARLLHLKNSFYTNKYN